MKYPFTDPTQVLANPAIDRPGNRVLLVDDEPRILNSLTDILSKKGYQLACASSSLQAMLLLTQNNFDIVILDIDLGEAGGGGYAVMEFIIARALDVDVIVSSGAHKIDAAIGALKRGVYDYLRKPFSREVLLSTLSNAKKHRCLVRDNRKIAAKLEESERGYRYLVDNSPDIIYTLNDKGLISFVNSRVQQILGFSHEELIGKHYTEILHQDDVARAEIAFRKGLVDSSLIQTVELRFRTKNTDRECRTLSFLNKLSLVFMGMRNSAQGKSPVFGIHGIGTDITDRKRVEKLLFHRANYDTLTDLPNRVLFNDRLKLALLHSKRHGSMMAVMFIDLDNFKWVNDTLGHVVGDELLQQTALRLKACLRSGDTLARQGGDEFIVVLPELVSRENGELIADKLLTSLKSEFILRGNSVNISASVGIAIHPFDGAFADELVRNSDMAMYHAKNRGKNSYAFYSSNMLVTSSQRESKQHNHDGP